MLSTLDETGAPDAANVAFSITSDGNILVGGSVGSRKIQNIARDSRVAVTVTNIEDSYTTQIKGLATVLDNSDFELSYSELHYKRRPQSLPFKDIPGQVHVLIRPSFVKFSDCSVSPIVVTEFPEWNDESE